MPKKHILLVDDCNSAREIVRIMLNYAGYQVTEAYNGAEGVQLFKNNRHTFDLVLTDYQMPEMDGQEMAEEIHQVNEEVPIIMGTGSSDLSESMVTKQWGIQALFHKPYEYEKLLQEINYLI